MNSNLCSGLREMDSLIERNHLSQDLLAGDRREIDVELRWRAPGGGVTNDTNLVSLRIAQRATGHRDCPRHRDRFLERQRPRRVDVPHHVDLFGVGNGDAERGQVLSGRRALRSRLLSVPAVQPQPLVAAAKVQ